VKRLLLVIALAFPALQGCSPRALATGMIANALSSDPSGGGVYAQDDDPELVRAAVPFGLKTMEGLLASHPDHEGLLTALASGFTQYAYAFVQVDADEAEAGGRSGVAQAGRARARKLYLRARDYGLRGLEARHEGIAARLRGARDLEQPLAELSRDDLPLAYWTAASWALAIAAGKDDMQLVAELPVPGALMRRALAIDETWDEGALHEFFVSWEAAQGGPGAFERAREHLARALELSHGRKLGVLVSYAESVCVPRQDRAEFQRLLQQVLAADVDAHKEHRLGNVLAQRRARLLLANVEDLFA
jgi:predicted anti-sigma-YlaC factor YlaD